MTNYTAEQIAAAARLVGDKLSVKGNGVAWVRLPDYGQREWQPWADTEAGRSDALVLLAAVASQFRTMDVPAFNRLLPYRDAIDIALLSGNVQQIQLATMAAAVAIGAHMKGVEA